MQPRTRTRLNSGNLPPEVSSFIGRDFELGQLLELRGTTRLLTLVGPGGVGKSRLAVRFAATTRDSARDGVWHVDVATFGRSSQLIATLIDMLTVHGRARPSWQQALAAMKGRELLLILDNCDQLIAACADLALALLRASRTLQVLATSREPLNIEGEVVWRVPPMAVPAPSMLDLASLRATESVLLFMERATAVDPTFRLTLHTAAQVAEICRHLGGVPLALELVAARIADLGLSEIAKLTESGLALNTTGRSDTPPRQQSLRATLDWSYALLNEIERVVFRRLAVFVGGWTLQAAEVVCSVASLNSGDVADYLERLVTKSLVQVDPLVNSVRYRFLDTVREYAREKLAASDEASEVRMRHANYMVALAERVSPDASDVAHAALLDQEQENLHAALEWTLREGEADLGLRLATAACTLWYFRGRYAEGSSWFEQLLALPGAASSASRIEALAWAGQLLHLQGRYADAQSRLRPALAEHRRRGDRRGIALMLLILGNIALWRGDLRRAYRLHREASSRLRELRNSAELVSVFQSAIAASELGLLADARLFAARCEELGEDGARPVAVAAALHLRGVIAARDGDRERALVTMVEAVELERRLGDQQRLVETLIELGHVQVELGHHDEALKAFSEAQRLSATSGERMCSIRALEGMVRAIMPTKSEAAVQIAAATARLRAELGVVAWPHDRRVRRQVLSSARRFLGHDDFSRAWTSGTDLGDAELDTLVRELSATPVRSAISQPSPTELTAREREVVRLLARGLSTAEVAAELVISPETVRTHLDHIMVKIGVHSRAQLVAWATRPPDVVRRQGRSTDG